MFDIEFYRLESGKSPVEDFFGQSKFPNAKQSCSQLGIA